MTDIGALIAAAVEARLGERLDALERAITNLASDVTRPASRTGSKWVTVAEASEAARVTTRTVRRWISIGLLVARRPAGGRVLVQRQSLERFLNGVTVQDRLLPRR